MKSYIFGWIGNSILEDGTAKAFPVTYANGYSGAGDTILWIPRSICIIEEANEWGNRKIYIPAWFFSRNHKDFYRIRDIEWGENGIDPHVKL